MAAYKVLQDVEAEDKLLGPLTFRQFVYAGIGAALLFIAWFVASRGGLFLAPVFLPPAVLAGFLAFPWKRDQPTEVWALAKLRFLFKPRKRVWDQSGVKELVTITAPKRIQRQLTDDLSQKEVKSRLQALASTLDSHGWVMKQIGAGPFAAQNSNPDRLVSANAAQPAAEEVTAAEDMFDEQNNPNAQRVSSLVDASNQKRRQKVMEELNQEKPTEKPAAKPSWFLNQPGSGSSVPDDMVTFNTQVVTPNANDRSTKQSAPAGLPQMNEEQIMQELKAREQESPMKSYYEHMHKVLPLNEQKKQAEAQAKAQAQAAARQKAQQAQAKQASPQLQAAMRQLSTDNNLSVATLARQANEVVVNLH